MCKCNCEQLVLFPQLLLQVSTIIRFDSFHQCALKSTSPQMEQIQTQCECVCLYKSQLRRHLFCTALIHNNISPFYITLVNNNASNVLCTYWLHFVCGFTRSLK